MLVQRTKEKQDSKAAFSDKSKSFIIQINQEYDSLRLDLKNVQTSLANLAQYSNISCKAEQKFLYANK